MNKLKQARGITLIALVITIIVLLILAGVTLSIVFNGGIIEKSQNAVDRYQNSSAVEQNQIENLAARFEQLYNERVVKNSEPVGTLLSKVHVGDYITYDPTSGVENLTKLQYTSSVGSLKVKDSSNNVIVYEKEYDSADYTGTKTYNAGDQVYEYNEAYNLIDENGNFVTTGYTVDDVLGNGYSNQTFDIRGDKANSYKLWRVLDDGSTTGTIRIVPENEVKTSDNSYFYMKGLRGYKNAVTELDNISAIFGHGTGAKSSKSIRIEDINALTEYDVMQDERFKNRYNTRITFDNIGKSWIWTTYVYEVLNYTEINSENEKLYDMLFKLELDEDDEYYGTKDYWVASLATEFANLGLEGNRVNLNKVRGVYRGAVGVIQLFETHENGNSYGTGFGNKYSYVLPVVMLKSSVDFKGGDGTIESPWTFQ